MHLPRNLHVDPPVHSTVELPCIDIEHVAEVKDRLANIDARVKAWTKQAVR